MPGIGTIARETAKSAWGILSSSMGIKGAKSFMGGLGQAVGSYLTRAINIPGSLNQTINVYGKNVLNMARGRVSSLSQNGSPVVREYLDAAMRKRAANTQLNRNIIEDMGITLGLPKHEIFKRGTKGTVGGYLKNISSNLAPQYSVAGASHPNIIASVIEDMQSKQLLSEKAVSKIHALSQGAQGGTESILRQAASSTIKRDMGTMSKSMKNYASLASQADRAGWKMGAQMASNMAFTAIPALAIPTYGVRLMSGRNPFKDRRGKVDIVPFVPLPGPF